MGRVYRAMDEKSLRRVAIKVLKDEGGERTRVLHEGWFKREVRALEVISHDAVLKIIAQGVLPNGAPYSVTEWLDGEDLQHYVSTHGPMNERRLRALIKAALEGLAAAHALSVVHRDLKPANLFLCHSGRVVVLDFGLARATNEKASETLARGLGTQLMGTPQYLSPEQLHGTVLSPKSDLFSFGAICVFLASGRPAFMGDSTLDVMDAIAHGRRPHVKTLAPHLSAEMVDLIEQLLATDPQDRPRDAGEVLLMLSDIPEVHTGAEPLPKAYEKKPARGAVLETLEAPSLPPIDAHGRTHTHARPHPPTQAEASNHPETVSALRPVTDTVPSPGPGLFAESQELTQVGERLAAGDKTVFAPPASLPKRGPSAWWLVAAAVPISVCAFVYIRFFTHEQAALPIHATVSETVPSATAELPVPEVVPTLPAPGELPTVAAPSTPTAPSSAQFGAPGVLVIQLKQWAEVTVDGKSLGKKQNALSLTLPPGAHELEFKNDRYAPIVVRRTIRSGAEQELVVDWKQQ